MPLLSQHTHDRAERLCRIHSERTVAEILRVSRSTLYKMKRRQWRAAATTHPFRKRPVDFAIQNRGSSIDLLARHYGTSTRVIRRWRREIGA